MRLRILHLEDDRSDAELVRETLETADIDCEITRVETRVGFITALAKRDFDLILADYTLPSFDGLSALQIAQNECAQLPFIFVSGTLGETVAIEALKRGATDYVFKTGLSRLVPCVRRALREAAERMKLSRTQEALRRSEVYLAEAQRLSHTGSFGWDVSNGAIYWSQETFRIFEYEPGFPITMDQVLDRTHPEDKAAVLRLIERVSRERTDFDFEHRLLMPDGSVKFLRVVGHPSVDDADRFEFVGAVTDITEHKQAEEIRVAERVRIARDLHDTLLQSFQGLVLHFQAAESLLPARPLEAKQALDRALDRAQGAIVEGRDAVQDLRVPTAADLEQALNTFGQELAALAGANGPAFRVLSEGVSRELPPSVRYEICRVAFEALRNAFRHAEAQRIDVDIIHGDALLQVRIRDDGKGIDPAVLSSGGRAGHWGLAGMRERAARVGAKLDIRRQPSVGTEVELRLRVGPGLASGPAG